MSEHVLVQTKSGPVGGRHRKTFEDIPFVSFHGIPYGKPPVGELRFKAPQPVDSWSETFDATGRSNYAPQITFPGYAYDPLSNENCLQLNVYTPSVVTSPTSSLRPVMVWIHGGGFALGSTDEVIYGPDFLLRKDIVLVTISYRLGPLGFLRVADPKYEIPGNAGLKDQALGLRWVQANIDRFGGNPNNVTLFGESAGSSSVNYHMVSEYSKGLFHKAIMQSGTVLSPFAYQSAENANSILATRLGWDGEGGLDAQMKVILNADTEAITMAQMPSKEALFLPCAEPYGHINSNAFLTDLPHKLIKSAWGNSIPLIIGCNSDEGDMFAMLFPPTGSDYDSVFGEYSPRELKLEPGSQVSLNTGRAIKQFYYGDAEPTSENLSIAAKVQADRFFWHGTIGVVRTRAQIAGSAPTYLYRFSFDSLVPEFKKGAFLFGSLKRPSCVHAEDLVYLFRQESVYKDLALKDDSVETGVISRFVDIWTTFARTGDPNCTELNGLNWSAAGADDETFKCLNLAEDAEIIVLPESERIAFWDSLYKY